MQKKANILIIAANREHSPFPVAPLGTLCIVAASEKAGHTVDFLDLMMSAHPEKIIQTKLRSNSYDVLGIGIRNLDNCFYSNQKSYFEEVEKIVHLIQRRTDAPIVLGGSGFSVDPYGWLERLDSVRYGVVGDGEKAFIKLLDCIMQKQEVRYIPGVIIGGNKKTDHPKTLPKTFPVEHLEDLSSPSHLRCQYKEYLKKGGFVSVQTKRGCSFKCIYCVYPLLEGDTYRLRPPAHVADEIEEVVKTKGAKNFYLSDSVFNTPRNQALSVCREISKRKLKINWMAYVNPLGFDSELAKAMSESGCVGVEFGLDVACKKMLDRMGKPFGQEEIKNSLEAAHKEGIPFSIHLLFGGPDETIQDIQDTQNFLNTCAPANAVFALMGIRIYPYTPLEQIALNQDVITEKTDLFMPTYYISPQLGEKPIEVLDTIARQRHEWTTPTDWALPSMKIIQWIIARTGQHPQWRNIKNYGKYMRRKSKKI